MRLRQLVLACGLTSFVLSPYASALGLGEVKLKSSLNQPLEAEVKLLDTRDLTAEQILVTLASPADFERNGVDRLYFYTELQFQVDLESADGPKVIIRSRNPVREPYLNFLIEARWTAGRLLREYTLLMDLPTFEEDARASSVAAPVTTASPTRSQAAAPATSRSTPAPTGAASFRQPSAATKSPLNSDEYEVRANDTLWEIALRARPNSGVTVHQSMMALYRENPDAFINGNINKLRRGQVLRIPDASEMTSIAKTEAVSQFAQATGDSSYGAQLNASRRSGAARTESAGISGRVKLAAPLSGANNSGQGSGANDGSGRALEGELAATLEELDKTKSENTELGSRVKDLETQIETMERLVAVSNEKLRALQVAAGQEVVPVESAASLASQASASVEALAAAASSAATVVPPQPAQPKPKPVVQQPAPEQGVFDSLKENPLWLALAVLGVFGAAAAAYAYRRRKQAEEQQVEDDDVFALDEPISEQDDFPLNNDTDVSDSVDTSLFEEDVEATAVAETSDVVGEADIYIAYGKLDQAEEMLLNALQKDPQSTDIRMKLLEVYAQQQNAPAFDKHYTALLPVAGAALISRAADLRTAISDAGEFAVEAEAPAESDFDTDFSLDDIDLDELHAPLAESGTEPAPSVVDDEFNFDFDLDLDDDEATIASLESAGNVNTVGNVSEFDFDLTDAETDLKTDADDISKLSLELDQLETAAVIAGTETKGLDIDEDFSFDFEDDLNLVDSLPHTEAAPESLEVVADDFNLDMNVDDVDLAALDHEMESLDVDFDGETDLDDEPAIADFVAAEIAKDEVESDLDLDDDITSLQTESELDYLAEDLASVGLVLTDDLDKHDEVKFDSALLESGGGDSSDELSLSSVTLADSSFDLPESPADLESLNEQLEALDEQSAVDTEDFIDLELHDEIPSALDNVDDLQAFAESLNDELQPPVASVFEQPLASGQDEDLFAEALSDFGTESDGLDIDAYSSDESALADLSDEEMDSELDFLADADEVATKLDLARAYIDMGDAEGAKDILSEVVNEGSEEQRNEANELLGRIV